MAGVQSCHVVGLQQHLQTVCCVLLGDGEGSVREFSGQIAYHTVIVLLIEGPIRADGVRDQLLHQPLVIVKLIQCGGVCLRGVPFQFGEKKVDEVMDGGIEHDNIIDISLIAGHLEFVIPPLVLPTSRHDEEKKWCPVLLFLLLVQIKTSFQSAVLLIHLLVSEQGIALCVLLGLVEKLVILFQ